jgi:hypothetical protein
MNSTLRGPWPNVRARIGSPFTDVPTVCQPSLLTGVSVAFGVAAGVVGVTGELAAFGVDPLHPDAATDAVRPSTRATAQRTGRLTGTSESQIL